MERIYTTHHSKRSLRTYRNLFMAIFLLGSFSIYSCGPSGQQSAETSTETPSAEEEASANDGELVFTEESIAELKSKFTFNEEAGWYYHNHWNQQAPKRRTLTADVNKTGYFYLTSVFYAGNPIKHTYIEATIGEEKMKSEKIAQSENENNTMKSDDRVFEIINYTNYRDNGILEAIAKSEGPVNIRYWGPDSYSDAELPASDKRALVDCFQLSLVLRAEAAQ